jgi:hypothetical protein
LLSAWRQKGYDRGYKPELLSHPPLQDNIQYIWNWFNEISSGRSYWEHGPNRISWTEIKAWMDITGHKLKHWEVNAIIAIDGSFFNVWYEK